MSLIHTIRKLLAGLLICSCLFGLNAAGCALDLQEACSLTAADCGEETSPLDTLTFSDVKTVAIY